MFIEFISVYIKNLFTIIAIITIAVLFVCITVFVYAKFAAYGLLVILVLFIAFCLTMSELGIARRRYENE